MKKILFGFIVAAIFPLLTLQAAQVGFLDHFKNRIEADMVEFTRVAGWTSQFRGLSPSSPLGLWGLDFGVELTSIPNNAFHLSGYSLELPPVFPRFIVAKGLTEKLAIEASLLSPKVLMGQVGISEEIENLLVYGGALRYTLLDEENYFISLGARIAYTGLNLDFFKADIFSGSATVSRKLSLPLLPLSVTPYVGAGYVTTLGVFNQGSLPFVTNKKHRAQNYRFFGGASLKLFLFKLTGQMDWSNAVARTYSVKISLDI